MKTRLQNKYLLFTLRIVVLVQAALEFSVQRFHLFAIKLRYVFYHEANT